MIIDGSNTILYVYTIVDFWHSLMHTSVLYGKAVRGLAWNLLKISSPKQRVRKILKNVNFELFFEMITIFFHALALSAATPLRPLLYIWCGGDRKLYYIPPWRQNSALSWREVLRESSHCDHILIFQGACWRFFFISFFLQGVHPLLLWSF